MKVVKTKYYEATGEMEPLDPQPVRVKGEWNYPKKGTDEKGDFVIIDFITEEATFLEYDAVGEIASTELKETTEDEWNKPVTLDIESMDLMLRSDAPSVDATTSLESHTTNLKTNQPTSSTVIEKLMSIIVRLFSNVYSAIIKNFR